MNENILFFYYKKCYKFYTKRIDNIFLKKC